MFSHVLQQQPGTGQQQQRLNRIGSFRACSGKPRTPAARDASFLHSPGRRQGGTPVKSWGRSGLQTAQQPRKHTCHRKMNCAGGTPLKSQGRSGSQTTPHGRRKKPKNNSTAAQAAAMLAAQPARFCSQHLGMLSWLVKHLMTSALMVSPESNDNSFRLLSKSDGSLN